MSKMTIHTAKFQEMVARAAKGASENKLLPITSMMLIELKDHVLTLETTDTANYLKIISDKIEGDDFYVVVPVDLFSKLIAKMTSDTITLSLKESSLDVKGNGSYSISVSVDEDGPIRFPEYKFEKNGAGQVLHLTSVKNIIDINKAAVSKTIETPCLCGYYIGEKVITTDSEVICMNDMKLFDEDYLFSPEMMELLSLAKEEKITCYYSNGYFLFETPDMVLYGAEHDGKDLYPVEDVLGYQDVEFDSMCKLPKLLLQNVIDRLSLFIESYDKNGAYFTFTKEGVKISSKRSSSVETINYAASDNFKPFVCCVDIPMLKSQIDSNPGDTLEVYYGNEAAMKLVSGKVTQILALLEDENLEGNISGE